MTAIDGLAAAAGRFGLHALGVEDAHKGHQRAKPERYGDTMFVVLRPASYDDRRARADFGEVHLFVGPQFVITVRHDAAPDVSLFRRGLCGVLASSNGAAGCEWLFLQKVRRATGSLRCGRRAADRV